MKRILVALLLVISPVASADAEGVHISCTMFERIIKDQVSKDSARTLRFYIDDSGERLVSETDRLEVQNAMFSDRQIDANISDTTSSGKLLFGETIDGLASIQIDRKLGTIALVAQLLPNGTHVAVGDCKTVAAP